MGKSRKSSPRTARKPRQGETTATTDNNTNAEIDRYLIPIVAAVSALVIVTGALTDQWRGAVLTEIQVLVVGAAARWGLRN